MLAREPNDTFLLYGIELQQKKLGDAPAALKFLDRVIAIDSRYCDAYHQKGPVFEALRVNRWWVDIHRRNMPLKNLDPALAGMKIVQVSDLHYSPLVWQRYLLQYIHWINELEPDLIVVTGDLITGGYRFAHKIATVL